MFSLFKINCIESFIHFCVASLINHEDEYEEYANDTDPVASTSEGANSVRVLPRFFEFSDLPNANETMKIKSKIFG